MTVGIGCATFKSCNFSMYSRPFPTVWGSLFSITGEIQIYKTRVNKREMTEKGDNKKTN